MSAGPSKGTPSSSSNKAKCSTTIYSVSDDGKFIPASVSFDTSPAPQSDETWRQAGVEADTSLDGVELAASRISSKHHDYTTVDTRNAQTSTWLGQTLQLSNSSWLIGRKNREAVQELAKSILDSWNKDPRMTLTDKEKAAFQTLSDARTRALTRSIGDLRGDDGETNEKAGEAFVTAFEKESEQALRAAKGYRELESILKPASVGRKIASKLGM